MDAQPSQEADTMAKHITHPDGSEVFTARADQIAEREAKCWRCGHTCGQHGRPFHGGSGCTVKGCTCQLVC